MRSVTQMSILGVTILGIGCGETTPPPTELPTVVESQDEINSEDGALKLTRGALSVQSISLVGSDGNVPLLGPVTLDLAVHEQALPLLTDIPVGEYTGLRIELAPEREGAETLDVDVQSLTTQQSVRATSRLSMSGETTFPEGPRSIAEDSEVELRVLLQGMFFYLSPISGAVDGHYDVDEENGGNFLTMDLINMFDLRVLR